MGGKHPTRWAQLTEAALAYARASAEDDREWMRARDRLRKAAIRYQTECREELEAEQLARLEAGMAAIDAVLMGGHGDDRPEEAVSPRR